MIPWPAAVRRSPDRVLFHCPLMVVTVPEKRRTFKERLAADSAAGAKEMPRVVAARREPKARRPANCGRCGRHIFIVL